MAGLISKYLELTVILTLWKKIRMVNISLSLRVIKLKLMAKRIKIGV